MVKLSRHIFPLLLCLALSVVKGYGNVGVSPLPSFKVMLDPGHGGKPERCSDRGGAHWDPYTKRFLNFYRYGVSQSHQGRKWDEHVIVLTLARKIRKRLQLTQSEKNWPKFAQIVKRVTGVLPGKQAVFVEPILSRDNSYRDHPKKHEKHVNRFFRLFDSPEKFPYKDGDKLCPGRLTKMAWSKPHLLLCLHINGSSSAKARGIHSLYAPSFQHFNAVRTAILARKGFNALTKGPIYRDWFKHNYTRSKLQWMFNDSWTYFTGFGCNKTGGKVYTKTDIGIRQNDIGWAYRAKVRPKVRTKTLKGSLKGKYWDRERSEFESRRRSGGYEGYGGDNLYASQELVRFVKSGLWRDYLQSPAAKKRKLTEKQYLGRNHRPTAADWAVPLYSNAIVAFLEIGYLTNKKDFWILRNKLDIIADGLAVGVYSLFAGTKSMKMPKTSFKPRGRAIEWSAYGAKDGTTYFERVYLSP